jgi:hypothetical protein
VPSLLGKQRQVGQYSLHSRAIFTIFASQSGGGGGAPKFICFTKKISGVVGHNPKKSGKFLSAPPNFFLPVRPWLSDYNLT